MQKFLRISLQKEGMPDGMALALLSGQLTLTHTKLFQTELGKVLESGYTNVQIDLSNVTYIDSTGLAAFIPIHQKFQEAGGSVSIINPRRLIRHIFTSSKLDEVLNIGPELEAGPS